MPYRLMLLAALVLTGCGESAADAAKKALAARRQVSQEALAKTPEPRVHDIDGNQLLVIDISVKGVGGFAQTQRCFVWRDVKLKTSDLSCPAAPGGLVVSED